jgi:hypothetical protein
MLAPFLLLASAPLGALANDVLQTNGYSSCLSGDSTIKVNKLDIQFDRTTKKIKFDVSGTNDKAQNVMATLRVNAYGKEVYSKTFDPCEGDMKVDQLCPGRLTGIVVPLLSLTRHSSRWYLRRKRRAEHSGHIHLTDPCHRFQRPGHRQPGNHAAEG